MAETPQSPDASVSPESKSVSHSTPESSGTQQTQSKAQGPPKRRGKGECSKVPNA